MPARSFSMNQSGSGPTRSFRSSPTKPCRSFPPSRVRDVAATDGSASGITAWRSTSAIAVNVSMLVEPRDCGATHRQDSFLGATAEVRRAQEVREADERRVAGRLDGEHVERGTGNATGFEQRRERLFVDQAAARRVHENRMRLQQLEPPPVE